MVLTLPLVGMRVLKDDGKETKITTVSKDLLEPENHEKWFADVRPQVHDLSWEGFRNVEVGHVEAGDGAGEEA